MTQSTHSINTGSLIKKVISGAIIGLLIISFFVFTVDHPKPEWGKFWMIRPLIITPLAGAFGGFLLFSPQFLNIQTPWKKMGITVLSFFAFIIALWMGIILGLDGTLWD
ncbi:potassium transporter KefB [Chryseobacterium defluvii]|uniref:Potassium transporter KefB n=1 Tax=Chryseobacterium defluvii TaxID=160396 RepID=A0A495SAX8_9FLAO|nr:potassium transporter KefB [Chryseobacterium defluvii]RKS97412.1 hypothetical protein BCF58_1534 [Chryseobacterium defluvii]